MRPVPSEQSSAKAENNYARRAQGRRIGLGAKNGIKKRDKLSLEEFKGMAPKFEATPSFNTYEDKPTQSWHQFIIDRGLEGVFILYPDGTIVRQDKKGLALVLPKCYTQDV